MTENGLAGCHRLQDRRVERLASCPAGACQRAARRARERVDEVRAEIDGGDEVSIEARAVAVAAP